MPRLSVSSPHANQTLLRRGQALCAASSHAHAVPSRLEGQRAERSAARADGSMPSPGSARRAQQDASPHAQARIMERWSRVQSAAGSRRKRGVRSACRGRGQAPPCVAESQGSMSAVLSRGASQLRSCSGNSPEHSVRQLGAALRNRTYLCMQPIRQYAPRSSLERAVRAVLRDRRCSGTLRGRSTRAIRRPRRQVCRRRRPPRRCCRARSIAAPIRSAWRAANPIYTHRHVHARTRHGARTRRRSPTDRTKTTGDGLNTS